MDVVAICSLCPSLLVFSGIAFSLLTGLPRLRSWLKKEFDKKLKRKAESMPFHDFFFFAFYLRATRTFDKLAFVYLVAVLVALLQPVSGLFAVAAYSLVLLATSALLVRMLWVAIDTYRTATAASIVDLSSVNLRKAIR